MFQEIVSVENLLAAWHEFESGKRSKPDVAAFSLRLMDHILALHADLSQRTYRHGGYQAFRIADPKPRQIHKASVRDRLVHHAIYRVLYPFFDRTFSADSFSCRLGKGTHKALNRFRQFSYQVSQNHTRTCWVLQCDIQKFFANIDQAILYRILARYIPDQDVLRLLNEVIASFSAVRPGVGLPLGNLTSQLLVNVYLNEFDQFMKHRLKAKCYIRYADDFVVLWPQRDLLVQLIPQVREFLRTRLRLKLHPGKVSVQTLASGVDFLGWVHFPDHRVLRTTTKRRMLARVAISPTRETVSSYRGLLKHGNAQTLAQQVALFEIPC